MLAQPGGHGGRLPVGQHVDALPAVGIDVYVAPPAHPTHPRTEEFLAEVRKAVSS
ncbi:hypothetical protein SHO565_52880 [Streptomyces sp. HO565]